MPLLVLAQTPPPVHGQSLMVKTLVEGLPSAPHGLAVRHVNLSLSAHATDIGRWQWGKLLSLRRAQKEALAVLHECGPLPLYYVPAPGKTVSVLRDLLLLPKLRRHASALVLHWHAAGLADWAQRHRWAQRWVQRALGGADLAVIPSACLNEEVQLWQPQRVAVVANGITVHRPSHTFTQPPRSTTRVLFLGLCEESKGIYILLDALRKLHHQGHTHFELQIAGDFSRTRERERFLHLGRMLVPRLQILGFVSGEAKQRALQGADVVCLPTFYPYEVQPLVAMEALAEDKTVVATRWRGLPEMLSGTRHELAEPREVESLAQALLRAQTQVRPDGQNRQVYLTRFTREAHLQNLAAALRPFVT